MNPLLKETIIFRPLTNSTHLLRYADNTWIPDDGKPDLAFVDRANPVAYYVSLPDYTDVIWTWHDLDLTKKIVGDEFGKIDYREGWHTMSIDNKETEQSHWDYTDKKKHPNQVAADSAMNKCCEFHSCASGRGVYLCHEEKESPYFSKGLVWIQSTMQPIKPPEEPICYLCLNDGLGHKTNVLKNAYNNALSDKEYEEEARDKAELAMYDAEYSLKRINETLVEFKKHPLYNPKWDEE